MEPLRLCIALRFIIDKNVQDDEIPQGFWAELFLLRPDLPKLQQVLENADTGLLIQSQHHSHQLLIQSIAALKLGRPPADEHALDVGSYRLLASRTAFDS